MAKLAEFNNFQLFWQTLAVKKLVLFDFDGTLADTHQFVAQQIADSLIEIGATPPPLPQIEQTIGRPLSKMFEDLQIDADFGEFGKVLRERERKFHTPKNVKFFAGTAETLQILKENNFEVGIVSTKLRAVFWQFFEMLGYEKNYFAALVGGEDVENHKPHAEPIETARRQAGVARSEIVYVGDNLIDAEAASAAKVDFVAVTTGHATEDNFKKIGVKTILSSIADLPGFFEI